MRKQPQNKFIFRNKSKSIYKFKADEIKDFYEKQSNKSHDLSFNSGSDSNDDMIRQPQFQIFENQIDRTIIKLQNNITESETIREKFRLKKLKNIQTLNQSQILQFFNKKAIQSEFLQEINNQFISQRIADQINEQHELNDPYGNRYVGDLMFEPKNKEQNQINNNSKINQKLHKLQMSNPKLLESQVFKNYCLKGEIEYHQLSASLVGIHQEVKKKFDQFQSQFQINKNESMLRSVKNCDKMVVQNIYGNKVLSMEQQQLGNKMGGPSDKNPKNVNFYKTFLKLQKFYKPSQKSQKKQVEDNSQKLINFKKNENVSTTQNNSQNLILMKMKEKSFDLNEIDEKSILLESPKKTQQFNDLFISQPINHKSFLSNIIENVSPQKNSGVLKNRSPSIKKNYKNNQIKVNPIIQVSQFELPKIFYEEESKNPLKMFLGRKQNKLSKNIDQIDNCENDNKKVNLFIIDKIILPILKRSTSLQIIKQHLRDNIL